MTAILNPILKHLESGDISLAFVVVLIAILLNFGKISKFFEERKRTKIERMADALKCQYLDEKTKGFLEEQISNEHFKLATGIDIEQQFRDKLITIHKQANGELSFTNFKRAIAFIFYEKSEIIIKISRFEKILYWFNWGVSFVMTAFGLLCYLLFSFSGKSNFQIKFQLFMLATVSILISIFMIFQTFPVRSAKLVEKEINNQRENT
jgi:hypothetical protein